MKKEVTILTGDPTIEVIAEMMIDWNGVRKMSAWVASHRPECLPDNDQPEPEKFGVQPALLFPHTDAISDNEALVELAGRKCYDAVTEVLTPQGWVAFPNLKKGTDVAAFNADIGQIVFERPYDYIEKKYEGSMYCVESRAFSMRVTHDHDMWCLKNGEWDFAPAMALQGKKFGVRRAAYYRGREFAEPIFSTMPNGTHFEPRSPEAWATLLGFFISEGTIVDGKKYGTGSRVTIYQQEHRIAPIIKAAKKLGFNPTFKTDPRNSVVAVNIHDTKFAEALAEMCGAHSHERRLPRHVFSWPEGLRARLLDALMAGDGTVTKGRRVYNTCSKQLADDVQTLIVLSGRPGSIIFSDHALRAPYAGSFPSNYPMYRVREGSQVVATVNNKAEHDWVQHDVDETVYCVSVPSRILVVRRNGKVFFCSNCYDSFGLKAGKKTNAEYIANTQSGEIPHASILYHAKMSFFFAGISRRVSHEIIRNYVGADRDEEGAPSQESTRFTHHYGFFICPLRYLEPDGFGHSAHVAHEGPTFLRRDRFAASMQRAYDDYLLAVATEVQLFERDRGEPPKAMDRKRIYEAASSFLPHQAETSFIWTTNPAAIAKLCRERDNEAADLEIQRFARKLKRVSVERWPNLFPQPWMKS
jgi:thymidylate synthase ThyX